MFPPEPIRTLMFPRSLRVRILAFLPEALNSAPVNEASSAKSLVPAEGNITPATVIRLLVMNRRREVVRVPGIMMAPDFCDSEKGCACVYGMHVQRQWLRNSSFDRVPVPQPIGVVTHKVFCATVFCSNLGEYLLPELPSIYASRNPRLRPIMTAWVRSQACSFSKIFLMCPLTVSSEI